VAHAPERERFNRFSIELAKIFSFATYITLHDERPIRVFRFIPPFSVNATGYLIREYGMPFIPLVAFKTTFRHTFSICGNIIRELKARFPDYPDSLIFDYLRVYQPLSHLKNYPGILQVFSVNSLQSENAEGLRIAVKAHFFYVDMLDFAFSHLRNIPCSFDLLCTVCSKEVEQELREKAHKKLPRLRQLKIEIVENRGRDIAPWLTTFQKEEEEYDLVLKFQTKKRLQQPSPFSQAWNYYNNLCILASESYVSSIINLFAKEKNLGVVFPPYPPMITITTPRAYLGNSEMRSLFREVMEKCAPNAPMETATPIFPAGTLFWYRPKAMRSLMNAGYTQESFPAEPLPPLTLAHVIERVVPYTAQSGGYYYKLAIPDGEMQKGYLLMEDRLLSHADWHAEEDETPQSLAQNGFRTLVKATIYAFCLAIWKRVGRK
jgi:rhamnosyltransferase